MTGVLAIRCNVQASCEARQRLLVSFGLFREPMEQLMGGAWRSHTLSAVRTGLPKQIGGGENKVGAESAQALVLLHAQDRGQWGVRWMEGRLQQTFRSTWSPGRVRGQLSFVTDDSMSAACLAWTGSVQFQGRGGHTTSRMGTRTSSAQPVIWTCVRPRDEFEVEELAVERKANRHEFDQQGHLWEEPIMRILMPRTKPAARGNRSIEASCI